MERDFDHGETLRLVDISERIREYCNLFNYQIVGIIGPGPVSRSADYRLIFGYRDRELTLSITSVLADDAVIGSSSATISGVDSVGAILEKFEELIIPAFLDWPYAQGVVSAVRPGEIELDFGFLLPTVKQGMRISVYRLGSPISNPRTGETLGRPLLEAPHDLRIDNVGDAVAISKLSQDYHSSWTFEVGDIVVTR
jgi:hypothetical protein